MVRSCFGELCKQKGSKRKVVEINNKTTFFWPSYFDEHNLKKIYLFVYIIIYIYNNIGFQGILDRELNLKRNG